MRVTKFIHSCVLVETPGRVALFDPGDFTANSGALDLNKLPSIDRLIITHPHPDHMDLGLVGEIVKKFPDVHIVGNRAVQEQLGDMEWPGMFREQTQCSVAFDAPHHTVEPFAMTVPNTGFHFQSEITHPGDSYTFDTSHRVLLMPIIAPWGTVMDALNKIIELKPEYVIPIHDWFYSEDAKDWAYSKVAKVLAQHDIKLIQLETGVARDL
jgi:L-ascorbate metabolism protein UlaG (beta-lactamase superfamily)